MPSNPRLRQGYPRSPTHKHHGTDILAREGSSVLAPVPGEVVRIGKQYTRGFSGFGKFVVLRTRALPEFAPTVYLLFAHLSNVEVGPGDKLASGARLGHVGRTKFTRRNPAALLRGPAQLHFEASAHRYPLEREAPRLNSTAMLRTFRHGYP